MSQQKSKSSATLNTHSTPNRTIWPAITVAALIMAIMTSLFLTGDQTVIIHSDAGPQADILSAPLWVFMVWAVGLISIFTAILAYVVKSNETHTSVTGAAMAVHQLIQNFPDAFALWDKNDKLVACNSAYQTLYRIPDTACVPGTSYNELRAHAIKPREVSVIGDEESRVIEARFGDSTWIELKEKRTDNGGYVSVNRDISKTKSHEASLKDARNQQSALAKKYQEEKLRAEQASDAKTNFLAHLSHDVRTPLNHIIGFADLMASQTFGPLGDARYADYVGDIKNSGESLLKSFGKILELAELDSGHVALEKTDVLLGDVLGRIGTKFTARAGRAKIKFDVHSAPDVLLLADSHSLERAVGNLIDNALKFTPAGGQVSLTTWMASDGLVLEITDSGIGMSPDRLKEVQQPFSMGDAMFARSDNALGIGLSVARGLAELHGGAIGIESTQGLGTTVAISLPIGIVEKVIAA